MGLEEELTLSHDASGRLYVDDERVWSISALGAGIVALTTGIRTVHISAADYWRALHGDASPSTHTVGQLTARLAHIEYHAAALIDALVHEVRITALRVALGVSDAEESAHSTPSHDAAHGELKSRADAWRDKRIHAKRAAVDPRLRAGWRIGRTQRWISLPSSLEPPIQA